jgi:hypothetical protein
LLFNFYSDNLFTSVNSLAYLKENGYDGIGTGHENPVPKGCSILLCCASKKLQRGHYEYRSCDNGILITRWHYHSTIYTVFSVGVAKIENSTTPFAHKRKML